MSPVAAALPAVTSSAAPAKRLALQGMLQGLFVDQDTSSHIDQIGVRLQMGKTVGVHQVARLLRDRSRQHHKITLAQRAIEVLKAVHLVSQFTSLAQDAPERR